MHMLLLGYVGCSWCFYGRHVGILVGTVLVPLGVRQLCVEVTLKVGPVITERRVQGHRHRLVARNASVRGLIVN